MKTLMLLRHAKSSWDPEVEDDIDRPLSKRGRADALRMGQEIYRRGWLPDQALLSPAERCCQTWELTAGSWNEEIPAHPMAELYLATPEALLEVISHLSNDVKRLLVLGHNPGLHRLALRLAGEDSNQRALQRLRGKFPTASLAVLDIEGGWDQLARRPGALTHCLRIKELLSNPLGGEEAGHERQ